MTTLSTFIAKNLPTDAIYAFVDEVENKKVKPIISGFGPEGELSNGKWVYSTVVGYHGTQDIDGCIKRSEAILTDVFHAKSIEWIDRVYWPRYNSHFKCADIKDGIYEKFEQIQGLKSTYYTGEILAGSGNGINIEYSYKLVKKNFM